MRSQQASHSKLAALVAHGRDAGYAEAAIAALSTRLAYAGEPELEFCTSSVAQRQLFAMTHDVRVRQQAVADNLPTELHLPNAIIKRGTQ